MIIREVEKPHLRDLIGLPKIKKAKDFEVIEKDILSGVRVVGSGKGAIALILAYLTKRGIISNKLDEVLVADWVGYWVYNQIQPFAFPAKRFSEKTTIMTRKSWRVLSTSPLLPLSSSIRTSCTSMTLASWMIDTTSPWSMLMD